MSTQTITTPGTYNETLTLLGKNKLIFDGSGLPAGTATYTANLTIDVLANYTVEATGGAIVDVNILADAIGNANYDIVGASSISVSTTIGAISPINSVFSGGGGGTLNLDPSVLSVLTSPATVTGFAATDQIDFGSGSTTGDTISYKPDNSAANGGTLELKNSGGTVIGTVTIEGKDPTTGLAYTSADFKLDASGIEYGCFNEGTAIATPAGEAVIESLAIGDLVITADGAAHAVKWVGYRTLDLRNMANQENNFLVRIKADAFAPHIPRRDLLVTQEHCIFASGGLIPARMLVNGRSIDLDRNIMNYTYYHVELEKHSILLAEGLATESYLDTGNRGNFANADTIALIPQFALNAGHKSWADAAAPLTVDAASVEPVWRMLDERAQALGVAKITADPVLTTDPDLNVVTGSGAVIRPVRKSGGKYLFMVPAGESDLRLISRTARPSEIIGAFMDDRRQLGVLVGEIALYDGRKKMVPKTHLETERLSGWFAKEHTAHRWTNGNAKLPVEMASLRAAVSILEIQIVGAGPYALEQPRHQATIAA